MMQLDRFVLCVKREDEEDLEVRKIYEVLPDELASAKGYLRVVDESGEDYLYPSEYFVPLHLPQEVEKQLASSKA